VADKVVALRARARVSLREALASLSRSGEVKAVKAKEAVMETTVPTKVKSKTNSRAISWT
jgi:hypothetical protein